MKLPKLLDCTLRDGGYINGWKFSKVFGGALYRAVSEAGCDFMEAGFFSPGTKNGLPWTNMNSDSIEQLRLGVNGGAKIAVMIDYGKVTLDEIPYAKDYPVDMIRVAAPQNFAEEATLFAAQLAEKGYATTVNYMGISNYSNHEILKLLKLMNRYKDDVDYFYVADSFGSLLPKRTREIFTTLRFGTDAALGFHPHNNLQLAFANCLEAMEAGVDIIDGSVFGMGRGAGNLFTDAMLAYYEQKEPERYQLVPILQFADLHMQEQREKYRWGYSLPQLLSGVFHCHPNYPTYLMREKSYTADDIYKMLSHLPENAKARYSEDQLNDIKELYVQDLADEIDFRATESIQELCSKTSRKALLVCGGHSVEQCRDEIEDFTRRNKLSVYTVNNPQAPIPVDGVFFGNRRRILQYHDKINADTEVVLGPEIHEGATANFSLSKVSRVNALKLVPKEQLSYPMIIPSNSAIEAILGLVQIGYKEIFLCGLDGYKVGVKSHYYREHDAVSIPEEIEKQNHLIAEELRVTATLAEKLGFEFSIITPTLFTEHALK